MGNIVCQWSTTIEEIVDRARLEFQSWGRWTFEQLKNLALYLARTVDIRQDGTLWDLARQFAREMAIGRFATIPQFVAFCNTVLKGLVRKVLLHPAVISSIKKVLTNLIDQLVPINAVNSVCKDALIRILEKCIRELERYAAGTGLKEVATNTMVKAGKSTGESVSRTALATASAKSALKTAAFVDVTLLGVSVGYSCYRLSTGDISADECKEHVTKRAVATGGSIAGTTTGAFVGSLIFPGVGTFVGGVVGGMVGDYFGSKAGEAAYKKLSHSHAE